MPQIIINDSHIDTIEKELFPDFDFSNGNHPFPKDGERRRIIKCLDDKDIVACAGSGKTTTLIAKLMILEKFFMPLPKNQGICVLTHTNVAIDEIKRRLGASSQLLAYPNFFGTIQSFVDRFLTIPSFCNEYGSQPTMISTNIWVEKMEHSYNKNFLSDEKKFFKWYHDNNNVKSVFKKMTLSLNDFSIVTSNVTHTKASVITQKFKKCREQVLKDGYITYEDAYHFANKYITEKVSIANSLIKIFSLRFKYVFSDEMQDSNLDQMSILDKLFISQADIVFQGIGDVNQTIFNNIPAWIPRLDNLPISNSRRFHDAISKVATNTTESKSEIKGNGTIPEHSPVILVFEKKNIINVIPEFAKKIADLGIEITNDKPAKAIGAVSSFWEVGKLVISNYTKFNKNNRIKQTIYAPSLKEYLVHNPNNQSARFYRNNIIGAILKALRFSNIDIKNEHAFIKTFKESVPNEFKVFQLKLTEWCRVLHTGGDVYDEVKSFIESDLKSVYPEFTISSECKVKFIDKATVVDILAPNAETHTVAGYTFEVKADTIHNVKGETHAATLYLETVNYQTKDSDIKGLLGYFKGKHSVPNNKHKLALRLAHVAVTRPKYLLCIAIQKSSFSDFNAEKTELEANGWKIEEVPAVV